MVKDRKKVTADAQTELSGFDDLSFTLMCSKPSHSTPKFSRNQCIPFLFSKGSLQKEQRLKNPSCITADLWVLQLSFTVLLTGQIMQWRFVKVAYESMYLGKFDFLLKAVGSLGTVLLSAFSLPYMSP